jgi:hypothetical protein
VLARVDDERPALGQPAVAACQRVHVQLRGGRIPVDGAARADSVLLEAGAAASGRGRHAPPPFLVVDVGKL